MPLDSNKADKNLDPMHFISTLLHVVKRSGLFLACTFLCRFGAYMMCCIRRPSRKCSIMRLYGTDALVGTSLTNSQYYENVILSICLGAVHKLHHAKGGGGV